jgi:hypothetical protein
MLTWLDKVRDALRQTQYGFTAVYVTLEDPRNVARAPEGVVEVFSAYNYKVWDITTLAKRR